VILMAEERKRTPQQLLDEAVTKGAIMSVMYFDVSANEKDAVQASLAELIEKITKEPGVISAIGEIQEPMEVEGMWSSAAEVTLLAKNFTMLANVAIRYGPIGVEVIKPDQIKLSLHEAQGLLLNVSQIGQDFAQYVVTKMMTEDERAKFQRQQCARMEMGKKLLEKKEK